VLFRSLRFIYTGRAPNLSKMADELLAAADKVFATVPVLCVVLKTAAIM